MFGLGERCWGTKAVQAGPQRTAALERGNPLCIFGKVNAPNGVQLIDILSSTAGIFRLFEEDLFLSIGPFRLQLILYLLPQPLL